MSEKNIETNVISRDEPKSVSEKSLDLLSLIAESGLLTKKRTWKQQLRRLQRNHLVYLFLSTKDAQLLEAYCLQSLRTPTRQCLWWLINRPLKVGRIYNYKDGDTVYRYSMMIPHEVFVMLKNIATERDQTISEFCQDIVRTNLVRVSRTNFGKFQQQVDVEEEQNDEQNNEQIDRKQ